MADCVIFKTVGIIIMCPFTAEKVAVGYLIISGKWRSSQRNILKFLLFMQNAKISRIKYRMVWYEPFLWIIWLISTGGSVQKVI